MCGLGSGFPAVTVSTASRQEVGRVARRLGCSPGYPFWDAVAGVPLQMLSPPLSPHPELGSWLGSVPLAEEWISVTAGSAQSIQEGASRLDEPLQPTCPGPCWRNRCICLCLVPVPAGLQELPRVQCGVLLEYWERCSSSSNFSIDMATSAAQQYQDCWCLLKSVVTLSPRSSLVLYLLSMWIYIFLKG